MERIWREAWRLPDNRAVWEWADDVVTLKNSPFGRKFDSFLTPWLREPLEEFAHDRNREITLQCCVQGGKTVALQVMAAYAIVFYPAPMFLNCQTDDDAKDFAKERLGPMLRSIDAIRCKLPEIRGNVSTTSISFPDMFLLIQGANLTNLQSKSIRWLLNDEVWLWKPGYLDQARKRTTQFWNRRVVNASTAGERESEIDRAFVAGDQRIWHLRCPSCNELSRPEWCRIEYETSEYTRPGGIWDYGKVKGTARYVCEHCKTKHEHNERVHKHMILHGAYLKTNTNPTPGHISFQWNALTLQPSTLSWGDLVVEWVKAGEAWEKGSILPRKEFVMKRLAESWDEWTYHSSPTVPELAVESDWKDEKHRFFTVDVQEREFWGCVRAWGDHESRLLWAGRMFTWDEVEAKQAEYKVIDACVGVDAGYDTRKVYEICSRHNKLTKIGTKVDWIGWKALMGEETANKSFVYRPKAQKPMVLPYSYPATYVDPLSGREGAGKHYAKLHYWSNDAIKDILTRLRDGRAQGVKWLAYEGASNEWQKQMFSERRIPVVDKLGQTKLRWMKIGGRPNHLWDCEAMQVVLACMAGLVGERMTVPQEVDSPKHD